MQNNRNRIIFIQQDKARVSPYKTYDNRTRIPCGNDTGTVLLRKKYGTRTAQVRFPKHVEDIQTIFHILNNRLYINRLREIRDFPPIGMEETISQPVSHVYQSRKTV